ncbi:putative phosphopantothenoylcysteine decarboxylase [Colletotrichum fructicola]|nr:putative phosphopantothenoylcysteine decarboxylase [Colletotrichum fructicola]
MRHSSLDLNHLISPGQIQEGSTFHSETFIAHHKKSSSHTRVYTRNLAALIFDSKSQRLGTTARCTSYFAPQAQLILTASTAQFLTGNTEEQPSLATIRKMKNVDGIHLDEQEWVSPWRRGASILHIELRRWADMMLIAPLSANTLAKIVNGFSDNLLLSVVRAWDPEGLIDGRKKRILVASAMNSAMHNHPITGKQLSALREWNWFEVLQPMEKTLACGDTGSGAMMDWREIVQITEARLGLSKE